MNPQPYLTLGQVGGRGKEEPGLQMVFSLIYSCHGQLNHSEKVAVVSHTKPQYLHRPIRLNPTGLIFCVDDNNEKVGNPGLLPSLVTNHP